MFDRITSDTQIMGGRACIRGMRITVSVIVGQIAHGASFEEILEGDPDLEREDIQQAIEYAASLNWQDGTQRVIGFAKDMKITVELPDDIARHRDPGPLAPIRRYSRRVPCIIGIS
jgi:uncharacterized protein (DUF433 family)